MATSIALLLAFFVICQVNAVKRLELVHIVYRHGARSPLYTYPTDKYKLSDWPGGGGRLTNIGMQMEFELGKFLKSKYVKESKFLGPAYNHSEVYVRSSGVDRCLQSAQVQLAGLFPPGPSQKWNKDIMWQPIPVHSMPKNEDPMLRSTDDLCPRRDELVSKKKSAPEYESKLSSSKDFLAKLSNYSGMHVTFNNLFYISDSMLAEKAQGWKQPEWINRLWDQILDLSDWIFINNYSARDDDEMGRLLGGALLQRITSDMKSLVLKKLTNKDLILPKMNIFSGHDTSVLSLAAGLDIKIERPVFASCIMVELYSQTNGTDLVEIYFRNNGTVTPLKLKHCNHSCPLDTFISLLANRISTDRSKECGRFSYFTDVSTLRDLLLVFVVVSFLLFLLLVILVVRKRCALARRKAYHEELGDGMENENLI